jgi:hypothetical protein
VHRERELAEKRKKKKEEGRGTRHLNQKRQKKKSKKKGIEQSCRYRSGLTIGMIYFNIGQYRRFVSGLPLYIYLLIYIFIHQNL